MARALSALQTPLPLPQGGFCSLRSQNPSPLPQGGLLLATLAKPSMEGWVSPFGHPRIKASLPAPRGFSQARTSFIACDRQGIHHMHFVT